MKKRFLMQGLTAKGIDRIVEEINRYLYSEYGKELAKLVQKVEIVVLVQR